MATTLYLNISHPTPEVTDTVYDIVQKDTSAAIALPIPGVLLKHLKELWSKPASVLVSACHLDHMYWVQQEGVEFLFADLKPNSMMFTMSL